MADGDGSGGDDGALLVRNMDTGEVHRPDSFHAHYEYDGVEGREGAGAPAGCTRAGAKVEQPGQRDGGTSTRLLNDPEWVPSALSLEPSAEVSAGSGGGGMAAATRPRQPQRSSLEDFTLLRVVGKGSFGKGYSCGRRIRSSSSP